MKLAKLRTVVFEGEEYSGKSKFKEIYTWLTETGFVLDGQSLRIYAGENASARILIPETPPILVEYSNRINETPSKISAKTRIVLNAVPKQDLSDLCTKLTNFGLKNVEMEATAK